MKKILNNAVVLILLLKSNFNCLMPKKNNLKSWIKLNNNISKKNINTNHLNRNALNTALKYTWDKRIKKLITILKANCLKIKFL